MGDDIFLTRVFQEKEFWKRYEHLRTILQHLSERALLRDQIQREVVIPDQARDLAAKALTRDLEQTRRLFFEVFENLVSQTGHTTVDLDIECALTVVTQDLVEVNWCMLWAGDTSLEIPVEIGEQFAAGILTGPCSTPAVAFIRFFEEEEARCDSTCGGIRNRCSLQVMEEIFPLKCLHIRFRLPARTVMDHEGTGNSRSPSDLRV
ncbi:MAG: hypothetical protein LUP93_02800 [Methanomicrobiales archaeon]|nr:hypothetical protein [Methanomicrobiales archaeon]MDD1645232.1 hypothetical protein [Methanomicrobiales archaeon]MDD1646867.1 hypothetical protein [Methanomicrobiales archaeon]